MKKGQILVKTTDIPSWIKEHKEKITGHQFDSLIESSGKNISEAVFRREFLPLFIATNDIPDDALDSFIKRWIKYAHQPYNSLSVYKTVKSTGEGVDFLFTVPPLWNPKAPILKEAATKPPKDEQGNSYEKDPTIFRTVVARINQYVGAQDPFKLHEYRENFLPNMVEEAPAIEVEDLKQWRAIFEYYGIDNAGKKGIERILQGQGELEGATEQPGTVKGTIVTGADEL